MAATATTGVPGDLELFSRARVDPAGFARAQVHAFTGCRLRIRGARIVHDVAWRPWLGDLVLPVPGCHQGWSGVAGSDDLVATTDPATCRKCIVRAARRGEEIVSQPALFELT